MTGEPTESASTVNVSSIPKYVREGIERQDTETLEAIARYAEELARTRTAGDDEEGGSDDTPESGEDDDDHPDDAPEDPPDGVPSKATIVVKEINDNRYYYWQWRDGDSVTSKYERPVDPDR